MTESSDIIGNGTDGHGEVRAGSEDFSGRVASDPADAETDSGSTGLPPAPSGVGGEPIPAGDEPVDPENPDGAGSDGGGAEISEEIDELAAAVSERDEFKDLALRAKADFENYRKRADRRVAETRGTAIAGVVRELLPVIDNLDRAVEAATGSAEGDAFVDGVRLVHADLHSVLDRLGLTPIDPAGEQFDPSLHEAISQVAIEGTATNTIVEVAQKGFMLGDTVVRPARVVVAS
ncbi:MAG: nucleotide exchange factor GrpE [Solirubrobacterales bacterium]